MSGSLRLRLAPMLRIFVVILVLSNLGRLGFLFLFSNEAVRWDTPAIVRSLAAGLRFDLAAFAIVFLLPLFVLALPRLPNAVRRSVWILILVLHFLWVAITFGDLVFYSIAHRRAAAEFVAVFASFKDFWSFLKGSALYVLIGLPVGSLPFYLMYRRQSRQAAPELGRYATLLLPVLLLFCGVIAIRGGLQGRPLNVTHAFVVGDYFWGNVTLNPVFATVKLAYTGDAMPTNRAQGDLPVEQVRKMFVAEGEKFLRDDYTFYRQSAPASAKSLKKNVVIFIMESWSAADLGWFGNERKATPVFDAIAADSLNYTNAFALGNRSITAIPTIASSIVGMFGRPYTTSSYANNKQRGMGSIFAEQGYATYFVTGYKAGAQGFSTYMQVAGFEKIITRENLGLGLDKSDGVWGIYDHHTFSRLHEILDAETKPFVAIVPSLHPHHPYKLPDDYAEKEFYKGFARAPHFNALRYSDFALGKFFERARKSRYFMNTVFIITADHTYTQNGVIAKYRIPLTFYAPGFLKPEKNATLASQLDILPTLISMLSVDTRHASMGKSLWGKATQPWAIIDLDGSMGYLSGNTAVMVNREAALGAYDIQNDEDFSRNLLPARQSEIQPQIREWFSYMNAVSDSISKNRIAPAE
ncbi:LTA synthase family protein [Turneriella parva]|uniref:Sulfatase n=1 Tax=Turneriella parva (strain ATCC BAA-1111 / DSM 21527 / NCTC 11395 / H) TaxID=869212 RepID=I4B6S3_TURPD|nr:alkaline phosphatase family protein [Turneriella parva]AFM12980.1 sulfatase [Turneriella parva DSM 21527]